jgi:hypothetical protein
MSSTTRGTTTTPTQTQEHKLSGNMGVGELVMNVLAFSSPLTTVAGTLPVMLLFSGHTAPGIYLLVTLMLLIFVSTPLSLPAWVSRQALEVRCWPSSDTFSLVSLHPHFLL